MLSVPKLHCKFTLFFLFLRRFCCDQLPRDVLVSATNEMLVLFRTFPESRDCDDVEYPWKCVMTFVGFKVIILLVNVFIAWVFYVS